VDSLLAYPHTCIVRYPRTCSRTLTFYVSHTADPERAFVGESGARWNFRSERSSFRKFELNWNSRHILGGRVRLRLLIYALENSPSRTKGSRVKGGGGGGRPGSSSARELSRFYLCFSFLFFLSSPLGRKDSRTRSSGTLPLMQSADRRSHDSQQRRNHSVIARLDDRSTHYARTRGRARVIDVVIGRSRERFWQRFDTHYDPNDRPPR